MPVPWPVPWPTPRPTPRPTARPTPRPAPWHIPRPGPRTGGLVTNPPGHRRAVVLGASVAGLLAARVLARHVDEVVVVDRDPLDAVLEQTRRGVPQGRHTHGLLVAGLRAIEDLLPGFSSAVQARGGLAGDPSQLTRWVIGGGVLHPADTGMEGMLASRTLLESEIRRRVTATPRIALLGDQDVVDLVATADGRGVRGVRVARRTERRRTGGVGGSAEVELAADLVVDATGRGSRAPSWMQELGFPVPPEEVVPVDVSYATRLFRSRPGVLDDLGGVVIGVDPPQVRGGVALRQEGDRWIVTLGGMHGERPPTDLAGFTGYAAGLTSPLLAEIATSCEPIGEATVYRFPGSRWRRWDKVARRPDGFVVIGDAVCSFNPVYGQGMSSAALQARALEQLLDDTLHLRDGLDRLPQRAAEAFAAIVEVPWMLATGPDRRYPGLPDKPFAERALDRYLDRLLRVARTDEVASSAFLRVLNLVERPPSLLRPRIALRVLGPQRTPRAAHSADSPPARTDVRAGR